MNPHELKNLQTKRAAAIAKANVAKDRFRSASQELNDAETELKRVNEQMRAAERTFQVSEHAVLRYVERVLQVQVATIPSTIAAAIQNKVEQLGDGRYPVVDGFVAVVRNKTVVTIEPK